MDIKTKYYKVKILSGSSELENQGLSINENGEIHARKTSNSPSFLYVNPDFIAGFVHSKRPAILTPPVMFEVDLSDSETVKFIEDIFGLNLNEKKTESL